MWLSLILKRLIPGNPYLLGGIFLAGLAVGGWTVHKFVDAKEAVLLRGQLQTAQDALSEQVAEAGRLNTLLATREKKRAQAQREAANWRRKWIGVQRDDPSCEEWSNTVLPDCAIRMFKLPDAPPGKGTSGQPDAADAKP